MRQRVATLAWVLALGASLFACETSAPDGRPLGRRTDPVLDLIGREPPGPRHGSTVQSPSTRVVHVSDPREEPPIRREGRVVRRVVLDPGHGGSDPGAIGATGVREKDVALYLAKAVAPILARDGIEVALTRDDDRAVSLKERTELANALGAALFVSLHCNSSESRSRRGIETYVLDTAREDMESRLAARENAAFGIGAPMVAGILGEMSLRDHASRSRTFASLVQRAVVSSAALDHPDVVDGGVHPAAFAVLQGMRMPAVLLEAGYLSHEKEEERLSSERYLNGLRDGLVVAIRAYRDGLP